MWLLLCLPERRLVAGFAAAYRTPADAYGELGFPLSTSHLCLHLFIIVQRLSQFHRSLSFCFTHLSTVSDVSHIVVAVIARPA